jgi:hypothetical protein
MLVLRHRHESAARGVRKIQGYEKSLTPRRLRND